MLTGCLHHKSEADQEKTMAENQLMYWEMRAQPLVYLLLLIFTITIISGCISDRIPDAGHHKLGVLGNQDQSDDKGQSVLMSLPQAVDLLSCLGPFGAAKQAANYPPNVRLRSVSPGKSASLCLTHPRDVVVLGLRCSHTWQTSPPASWYCPLGKQCGGDATFVTATRRSK